MSNPFFDQPTLNSPYAYPSRHWELDEHGQPTQQIIDSRRKAEVTPIENLTINENVVNPGWEEQMRVLIVALGLSLSLPDDQMVDYVVENFSKPQSDGSPFSTIFDFPTARWV
jgi:hypothetical protein